ncbi:class I SAM-dependent methyltransferase [Streptomyces sp. NPDC004286]|uniref:class I SAM-dependent methyltransferase n=1 Tax=Streptomyces sp. NPDC004286 TaxID=3364696 RepID=UPI003699785B
MTQTKPLAPRGVSLSALAAQYDAFHAARGRTDLVTRLYATAMGEDYPVEVAASSSCDWPLLGLMTTRLRMTPGQVLVDAGCGNGGIGLWLTRALAARLHGLDISPVAIKQARARLPQFVTGIRATFRVGSVDDTGLPDRFADGIIGVDALGAMPDRAAVLRELGRVLAPGGRLVLTRGLRREAEPPWEEEARAAGLVVEHVDERPGEPATWSRLYHLWLDHADDLRRELGAAQADYMLAEARRVLPTLRGRRAVLLTLRRPTDSGGGSADTMTAPGRLRTAGPTPGERTPQ